MKFRLIVFVALFCVGGVTVFGQELAGTWQGTLSTPAAQFRVVFKITATPDGKFTGQSFSIDQNPQPIPMNAISVEGRTVKWKLDLLSASYAGTFAADGNTLNGTMTQ